MSSILPPNVIDFVDVINQKAKGDPPACYMVNGSRESQKSAAIVRPKDDKQDTSRGKKTKFERMREICKETGGIFANDFPDHPIWKEGYTITFGGRTSRLRETDAASDSSETSHDSTD